MGDVTWHFEPQLVQTLLLLVSANSANASQQQYRAADAIAKLTESGVLLSYGWLVDSYHPAAVHHSEG